MKKIKLLTPMFVGISSIIPITTILTSCSENQDQLINKLYESTIEEFIEYSKHPHPSYHLDEARCYLINKLKSWGYEVMKDNYGNLWFDIPASSGREKEPELILQAHMDMVCKGFEGEEASVGVEMVKDKDADNREILHSKDYKTSIGADDGIGVAIILAVAKNKFSHGPIRGIITADEEEGLLGAMALSSAALNSDYLLNLDGEGEKAREYIVQRGCAGLSQYLYSMNNLPIITKGNDFKSYSLSVKGFIGDHFNHDVAYTKEGTYLKDSADWYLVDVLNNIVNSAEETKVGLINFNHKNDQGVEPEIPNNYLTQEAEVIFTTNADLTQINKSIKEVYDKHKQDYRMEDWSKIAIPTVTETTDEQSIRLEDSEKIIEFFSTLSRSVPKQHWEGDTDEEKASKNYPNKNTCFTKFTLKITDKGSFSAVTRGAVGTNQNSIDWYKENIEGWLQLFPNNPVNCTKNYLPWDPTGKTKMIEMAIEGFKDQNISPAVDRTRGGLEPSCFSKRRDNIQQACIGPRIDDIHTPKETLYLDTLPSVIKCMMYVINNMTKFESK